jgi:hypothetical protein
MLIVCIFLVRAAFVFIGFFSNWSFVSYFDLVYYAGTEILPITAMFFILLWRSPNSAQQHQQAQVCGIPCCVDDVIVLQYITLLWCVCVLFYLLFVFDILSMISICLFVKFCIVLSFSVHYFVFFCPLFCCLFICV